MTERPGPVLVTGTSSGIGRRITESLSEQGHEVLAAVRKKSDMASLAKLPHVTPLLLDVTREDSIRESIRVIHTAGRGLYGLVNNAGIGDLAPLLDTSVEELGYLLNVNLYGMHRMVRACFPFLMKAHGRIVNIGSINGVYPEEYAGAYCISKYAVEAYTDVLGKEFAPLGIKVSVVEPGGFRSNISSSFFTRKGDAITTAFEKSPFREAMRKYYVELQTTPGEVDRSKYPDPRPVAEAVLDALFSKDPKRRYLVGSREETDAAVTQVMRLLAQLNQRHEHSLTADELSKRLRATVSEL
jgi:NAD(P)-dependent dehydrogenase (short-subunit alcohol dehydrogenase family)